MKKLLRFGFLITLAEKRELERLAEDNGESQASFLRRLIRQAARQQSLPNSSYNNPRANITEGVTDSETIHAEEVI